MYGIQTFAISNTNKYFDLLVFYLLSAKEIYNQALFYARNVFTGCNKLKSGIPLQVTEKEAIDFVNRNLEICNKNRKVPFTKVDESHYMLSYYHLEKLFTKLKVPCYANSILPAQCKQKVINRVTANMQSFMSAVVDFSHNSSKYKGKPKMPGYRKEGQWVSLEFTNQAAKIKQKEDGYYLSLAKTGDIYIGKNPHEGTLKQVLMSYEYGKIVFHLVFEEDKPIILKEDNKRYLGIDLGINNFATVSNNIGIRPIVVKGKAFKARNQWFNKRKAFLTSCYDKCQLKGKKGAASSKQLESLSRKRSNYFRDSFHKIAKYILNYAVNNNISKIVIGNNKGWKQSVDMGKRMNQTFVSIPFQQFITILKNKGLRFGIEVVITEESYTSQSSILDLDILPVFNEKVKTNYVFHGSRVKTKEYQSRLHGYIHADVNGASNIIRKYNADSFNNMDLSYLKSEPLGVYAM